MKCDTGKLYFPFTMCDRCSLCNLLRILTQDDSVPFYEMCHGTRRSCSLSQSVILPFVECDRSSLSFPLQNVTEVAYAPFYEIWHKDIMLPFAICGMAQAQGDYAPFNEM